MKRMQTLFLLLATLFASGCTDDSIRLYDHLGNRTSMTIPRKLISLESAQVKRINGKQERYVRYFDTASDVDALVKIADLRLPTAQKAPITYRLDPISLGASKRVRGRTYPIGDVSPTSSNTGRYFYFLYDDSYLYKWDWEVVGNYFFDAQGEFLFSLPERPETRSISFSSDDSYLIEDDAWDIDADTVTVYSLPNGLRISQIRCSGLKVPGFAVYGNRFLFYTTPDNQLSLIGTGLQTGQLRVVDLSTQQDSPVAPFDTTHWYALRGLAGNDLDLEELGTTEDEDQPIIKTIPIPKRIQDTVK